MSSRRSAAILEFAPSSRRRSLIRIVALVAAAAALSTSTGAAAGSMSGRARISSGTRRRCQPKRSQILTRHGASVLFMRITGPNDGKYGAPHSLLGCDSARQAPVELVEFEDGDIPGITVTSFNGAYAAFYLGWEATTCVFYESAGAEHCGQSRFDSVNLRTGRVRVSEPEQGTGTVEPPTALVVNHEGWIAWIAPERSGSAPLLAQNSKGRRMLDPGPIDSGSLRISGKTVRWTDAGIAHSAPLR